MTLHPISNDMTEIINGTNLNNFSFLCSRNQQDYDHKFTLFLLGYPNADCETSGYVPTQVLFGPELRLSCDLLFGRVPYVPSSAEEYIQLLQIRLDDVHSCFQKRACTAIEKTKTYDTKETKHEFNKEDKVWFWNTL